MTSVLVLTPVFLFALSLAFIVRIFIRLQARCRRDEITSEWFASFSARRYHPMQALLDREDFTFLARQPGFDFALYRKLRRDRLRIFRQYLNRLITDYNRLHARARMLLADTQEDQSEMLVHLLKLKLKFSVAVFRAEGTYLLCCVGFRTLAVRALILRLEEMSAQVSAISDMELA